MQSHYDKKNKMHFIKLEPGEDILQSLTQYCKDNNVKSGLINGIGAVEKAIIGFFDLEKKTYSKKTLNFNAELLNCAGNIAIKNETNNDYIVHCHIVLADQNFVLHGGHLFEGTIISATGEFIIIESDTLIKRVLDKKTDLFLQDLKQ